MSIQVYQNIRDIHHYVRSQLLTTPCLKYDQYHRIQQVSGSMTLPNSILS